MMKNIQDYSALDHPAVLPCLFHPRPEPLDRKPLEDDFMIQVDETTSVGACFHMASPTAPNILFFHGNGEIVSDYDDLGMIYKQQEINFLAVDYRGYGRSNGSPTVAGMMKDCHLVFDAALEHLNRRGCTGPLSVMGRSMGSAPALELAAARRDEMKALIIESGFAHITPLLKVLGVDPERIGFHESNGFKNLETISTWEKPLLIIHAELDHLIPFSEGTDLFSACPSENKRMLRIDGANHNDIFLRGMRRYMEAVKELVTNL